MIVSNCKVQVVISPKAGLVGGMKALPLVVLIVLYMQLTVSRLIMMIMMIMMTIVVSTERKNLKKTLTMILILSSTLILGFTVKITSLVIFLIIHSRSVQFMMKRKILTKKNNTDFSLRRLRPISVSAPV
jgi:predicted membrane protein